MRAVPAAIMVIDDDLAVCDAVACDLSEKNHDVIICRDVESARLVLDTVPVSHVLTDVKLTGPFRFEGLDVIDYVKGHGDGVEVLVMTGYATDELRREVSARGAMALLEKPFVMEELHRYLAPGTSGGRITIVPTIDEIVTGDQLVPRFQPIVRIGSGEEAGFEALIRLREEGPVRDPETLFQYAAEKGRLIDLELAAAAASIRTGRPLADRGFLALNIHPGVFSYPVRLVRSIADSARAAGLPMDRLILEITEQGPLPEADLVGEVVHGLRALGVRFAYDDVGMAYSHLRFIATVQPAYLKVSQQFGTNCESISAHRNIVENVNALAHSFGSDVILEGIESEATARFARDAGIGFGQGFLFGRPSEAAELTGKRGVADAAFAKA